MRAGRIGVAALCAVVSVWMSSAVFGAAPLVGSGWPRGILYDIDPATGDASNPRSTGLVRLIGITDGGDGYLYGFAGRSRHLHRIDPFTGESELVEGTGLCSLFEGDLDFDPISGTLYTVQRTADGPRTTRDLVTIDLANGEARAVGELPVGGDPSAMAFDPGGTLYVLDTARDLLLTVDPQTADVLSEIPVNVSLGSAAGMDFDPLTGLLYVADGHRHGTDALYTLDPATGDFDRIGSTGLRKGLAGLQFLPEPATLSLMAAGALLLFRRNGRSNRSL